MSGTVVQVAETYHRGNPKSEARNPKEVRMTEMRNPKIGTADDADGADGNRRIRVIRGQNLVGHGFRISDFGFVSDFGFGFRISGRHFITVLLCLSLLPACTVGPDYHRPAPLPTNCHSAGLFRVHQQRTMETSRTLGTSPAAPGGSCSPTRNSTAWKALATAQSQELAVALARFDEAQAAVNVARADFFPQVQLDPSYTRQRTSFNQPQNGHPAGVSPTYNTFTLRCKQAGSWTCGAGCGARSRARELN